MIRYAFYGVLCIFFFTRAVNILGPSTMFFDAGENSSSRRYFPLLFHGWYVPIEETRNTVCRNGKNEWQRGSNAGDVER